MAGPVLASLDPRRSLAASAMWLIIALAATFSIAGCADRWPGLVRFCAWCRFRFCPVQDKSFRQRADFSLAAAEIWS